MFESEKVPDELLMLPAVLDNDTKRLAQVTFYFLFSQSRSRLHKP